VSSTTVKPTAAESWRMFDRIAPRYDLLNRLLSFRRDVAWRRAIVRALPPRDSLRVLDLATGTADVLISLCATPGKIARGVGLDKSAGMIARGREKLARDAGASALDLVRGDACGLGFADETFDAVTMAFGIRNVPDVPAALREIRRVLRPGGRALILEFSLPRNAFLRTGYLAYFRHVLPRVGGMVSGDAQAYRYLNESVESFPYGETYLALMRDAGFTKTAAMPQSFGIATLYTGDR
jgi:demethylmenaquinone methyltransferase/2-methoxy-6-polyprenyl-1,4-benzoquinol methylase